MARTSSDCFAITLIAMLLGCGVASCMKRPLPSGNAQASPPTAMEAAPPSAVNDPSAARYQTHSPFDLSLPTNQEAGQADPAAINPLLGDSQIQMQQQNAEPKPIDTNRGVAQKRMGFANTGTRQGAPNQAPGNPSSNVPGTTNTSPGSRNQDFETYGRALPILPAGS